MTFRILIDGSACNGYGSCVDIDPADFQIGDDGIARAGVVAVDGRAAREAARQCPMGAITVVDEAGVEAR
jgi:ferredoxin